MPRATGGGNGAAPEVAVTVGGWALFAGPVQMNSSCAPWVISMKSLALMMSTTPS